MLGMSRRRKWEWEPVLNRCGARPQAGSGLPPGCATSLVRVHFGPRDDSRGARPLQPFVAESSPAEDCTSNSIPHTRRALVDFYRLWALRPGDGPIVTALAFVVGMLSDLRGRAGVHSVPVPSGRLLPQRWRSAAGWPRPPPGGHGAGRSSASPGEGPRPRGLRCGAGPHEDAHSLPGSPHGSRSLTECGPEPRNWPHNWRDHGARRAASSQVSTAVGLRSMVRME